MTVGVRIATSMDTIGIDKTVTAEIITVIIGIMEGVMMTAVETAGMNAGVITAVAMEMVTAVVDMGDMPITWVRSAAALILVSAHPSAEGAVEGVLHTLAPSVGSQEIAVAALLHALWMHTTLRVWMMDTRVHILLPNIFWTERKLKSSRTVGSSTRPVQKLKQTIRVVWPGMESGTSVSRIPTPMPSLWLRRDTIIVFILLTVRLLIGTSVSWVTTIPCWNLTGKNTPALFSKFIGNVRRMSVVLTTVSVRPEKALDATAGNVANKKSRQKNVRVEMCQVKYLFQLFWIVIHWLIKTH